MKPETIHHALYELIREYMHALGTSRTTLVALKSYIDAIRRLKSTDAQFRWMLANLNTVIKNTEPKVIPLVHLIEAFEAEMEPSFGLPLEAAKKQAIAILTRKLEQFEADTAKLTMHCMNCIAPDDFIIAHSATAYIRDGLVRAHTELKRGFKVLVVKQDVIRSKMLINSLAQHNVEHIVIPEYNLSHYLKSANKLFIGAVSVTSDDQVVAGIGTANVVSLCHWYQVPVHLFVESLKFAHHALSDQHIHDEEREKTEGNFTFHMKTFSHDFVDLEMIDHLITEMGERGRDDPRR
jgi:translation initiation factor eIF-2B subunit alpha